MTTAQIVILSCMSAFSIFGIFRAALVMNRLGKKSDGIFMILIFSVMPLIFVAWLMTIQYNTMKYQVEQKCDQYEQVQEPIYRRK
jgi:hypothetical protein